MMDSLSSTSSNPFSTFDPVANIVSAVNLHRDCPPSLLQALATSHPDHDIWLQSYYKEKSGIESLVTFCRISLGEYPALREKGASKAIPTMCVLNIKKDKTVMPLRAKLHIIVLENQEDRDWSKSDCFTPVLQFDSLRFLVSLAVQRRHGLKQGNLQKCLLSRDSPPQQDYYSPPSLG
jgi:hypothetical protein